MSKSDNRWLCLNCHTPLMVPQAEWPRGWVDGDVERPFLAAKPSYDETLRDEGITCVGCHLGDEGAIYGPGLPDAHAPHTGVADPEFRSEKVCLRCHQAEAIYPGKRFVCTFETGAEWREGGL